MIHLPLLHAALNGNGGEVFASLSEDEKNTALQVIGAYCLEPLFLPQLAPLLPPEKMNGMREKIQRLTVQSLVHEYALKEICLLFEQNNIRHCLFKGTDLAYRIYPNPSLRHFGDWDILFHPEEFQKACELLQAQQWIPAFEIDKDAADHHWPPMRKNAFVLEPHFTFSHFEGVDPRDLWQEIRPFAGNSCRHILSPELNLLMLTRHAAADHYRHIPLERVLLDTHFLIQKEKIDWDKVHTLADKWNLPRPDDLLGAWPEFFPAEVIAQMSPDPRNCRYIRTILGNDKRQEINSWDLLLHDNVFSARWFKRRFGVFTPKMLRRKYQDEQTPYLRLLLRDLRTKAAFIAGHLLHRDDSAKRYIDALKEIEKSNRK